MSLELTVLIPTLNEEASLRGLLPGLRAALSGLGVSHEILVVDGGSGDETEALAASQGARVFRQNGPGFGAAVREGLGLARGEWVAAMDGDGSHPPAMLPRLW